MMLQEKCRCVVHEVAMKYCMYVHTHCYSFLKQAVSNDRLFDCVNVVGILLFKLSHRLHIANPQREVVVNKMTHV